MFDGISRKSENRRRRVRCRRKYFYPSRIIMHVVKKKKKKIASRSLDKDNKKKRGRSGMRSAFELRYFSFFFFFYHIFTSCMLIVYQTVDFKHTHFVRSVIVVRLSIFSGTVHKREILYTNF